MIFNKIWEKYFLKEVFKIFFLFLFCFFGLYIIIDYASHTSAIGRHQTQIPIKDLAVYYFNIFISRAEILIPFALLIAVVKTLCSLNTNHELTALMASGLSIKKLLRPFLSVGLLLTALMYLNEELILPESLTKLKKIEDSHKNAKRRNTPESAVQHLLVEDGSVILYQSYDTAKQALYDAYWIRTTDDIYRIKYLYPYLEIPKGIEVGHFIRQPNGELIQSETVMFQHFPEIQFNPEALHATLTTPDLQSISSLAASMPAGRDEYSEKESQSLSAFYWKMVIPWLCFLAVIGPIPSCIKFSRTMPVFFIYVFGIFGLLAFYLVLDAAMIVAKRQVLEPFWAIVFPFLAVFAFLSFRYIKVR